jgi:hypothetical protein
MCGTGDLRELREQWELARAFQDELLHGVPSLLCRLTC